MSSKLFAFAITLLVVSSVLPLAAVAQTASTSKKVYVAFRMQNWKAKHIHDEAKAKKFEDTLKMLGCEVKNAKHNGHIDVSCRTIFWKTLALDSHDLAHQWVTWFKAAGFDIIHGHVVGTHKHATVNGKHPEIVQYRLADWSNEKVANSAELNQLLALYQGLGIEVENLSSDLSHEVRKRCPKWMEIELPTHDAAHKWQTFLNDAGFETKHEH